MIYAGIGSRETPPNILNMMTLLSKELTDFGWKLRTGGATGADTAFAEGTARKEVHLPWDGYNGLREDRKTFIVPNPPIRAVEIAAEHHPIWDKLSAGVRRLMLRNVTIVLGKNLDEYAEMVVCWTPRGLLKGGTAHGMKVAYSYDIPVFNLAIEADITRLTEFVRAKDAAQSAA